MPRECPPNTRPYTIKAGDTLFNIAINNNTTVPAIISVNPEIDPNNLRIGEEICVPGQREYPACPEGNYYTIKTGDTIFSIASFYNVSVDDLIEANPGIDVENLRIGQIICIPLATPPVTCPEGSRQYTVKRGDTFYSIAEKYNTSVEVLYRYNPTIRDPQALLIGQKICVPD